MKNLLLAALLFIIVIFQSGRAYGDTTRESLVVLGDSIASGYGLAEYTAGNSYSAPLSFGNMLGAEFESYQNFAVDGRTSAQLLYSLEEPSEQLAEALASADEVVISIGGNDFLKPMMSAVKSTALGDYEMLEAIIGGEFKAEMIGDLTNRVLGAALEAAKKVDIDAIADNIEACVAAIRGFNPNAEIVVLTVYDPFSGNMLLSAASDIAYEKLHELNGRIFDIEGIKVADVYSAFDGKAGELTNINRLDIHPNADGHNRIYELLGEIIRQSEGVSELPEEGAAAYGV